MGKNDIDLDMSIFDDDKSLSIDNVNMSDRKPTQSVKSNIKDVLTSAPPAAMKTAGKHILRSMPDTSILASDASQAKSILSETAGEIKEELNKYVVTSKRAAALALPNVKKILPKKMYSRLEAFSKINPKANTPSGEDLESQRVQSILDQMFSNQANIAVADMERKASDDMVNSAKEAVRHTKSISVLASINDKIAYQNKFLGGVQQAWMRKVLELKYMHLYTAKETLSVLKAATDSLNTKMDAVVKNTALPDMVKARGPEFLKYSIRGKITDRSISSLSDIARVLQKRFKEAKETSSGLNDALNMGIDAAETAREMGMRPKPYKMLGGALGGIAGHIGGRAMIEPLRPITDKVNDIAMTFKSKLRTGGRGLRDKLLASDNPLYNAFGAVIPATMPNLSVGNDLLERGGESSVFDNATRQSIVEIIPSWLSIIAKNTKDIATGTDNEQQWYDVTKRKIVNVSDAKKSIENRMLGDTKSRSQGIVQSFGYLKSAVEKNKKVNKNSFKKHEKDLLKLIDNAVANGITIDGNVIKKYAKSGSEEDISGNDINPLMTGITDKKGVLTLFYTLLYNKDGRLDEDTLLLINRGILSEQNNNNMKKNFSKFLEDFGAYSIFADDITGGNISAEVLSKQRLDLDSTSFSENIDRYGSEYSRVRNIKTSNEETMRNSKLVKKLSSNTRGQAKALADKNIPFISTFARLFEESTGLPFVMPVTENKKQSATDYVKSKIKKKISDSLPESVKQELKKKHDYIIEEATKLAEQSVVLAEKAKDKIVEISKTPPGERKALLQEQVDELLEKSNKLADKAKTKILTISDMSDEAKKKAITDKVNNIATKAKNAAANGKRKLNSVSESVSGKVPESVKRKASKAKTKISLITKELAESTSSKADELLAQSIIYKNQATEKLKKIKNKDPEEIALIKEQAKELLAKSKQLAKKAKVETEKVIGMIEGPESKKAEAINYKASRVLDESSNTEDTVENVEATPSESSNPIVSFLKRMRSGVSKMFGKFKTKSSSIFNKFLDTLSGKPEGGSGNKATATITTSDGKVTSVLPANEEFASFHNTFKNFMEIQHSDNLIMIDTLLSHGGLTIGGMLRKVPRAISSLMNRTGKVLAGAGKVYKDIYTGAFNVAKVGLKTAGSVAKTSIPVIGDVLKTLITGSSSVAGKTVGMLGGFYKGLFKLGGKAIDKAPSLLLGSNKEFVDIYRKGEIDVGNPLLSIRAQKRYAVRKDGEKLSCSADVTMPIIDRRNGKSLITQEDIEHGLVDINGSPITKRKNALSFNLSMPKGLGAGIKKLLGGGLDFLKGSTSIYGALLKGAGIGIKGIASFASTKLSESMYKPITSRLDTIINLLGGKKVKGDTDGDGDRDGSYADRIKDKVTGKNKKSKSKDSKKAKDTEDDENEKSSLKSKISKAKQTIDKSKAGIKAGSTAFKAARAGGGGVGKALLTGGRALMSGGVAAGGTAAAAGTAAAGTAAAGAGLVAAAPWILGAAAVGGLAYGGYKLAKHLKNKKQNRLNAEDDANSLRSQRRSRDAANEKAFAENRERVESGNVPVGEDPDSNSAFSNTNAVKKVNGSISNPESGSMQIVQHRAKSAADNIKQDNNNVKAQQDTFAQQLSHLKNIADSLLKVSGGIDNIVNNTGALGDVKKSLAQSLENSNKQPIINVPAQQPIIIDRTVAQNVPVISSAKTRV